MNIDHPTTAWLLMLVSFCVGLFIFPRLIRYAFKKRIVDRPGHRKLHRRSVAYLGGAGVFAATAISLLVFWAVFREECASYDVNCIKAVWIMGLTLIMMLLGLADDIHNLRARYKLALQMVMVTLFAIFGFHFETLHIPGIMPYELGLLAVPVTVFWMLAVVNAFNLIDGVDGLLVTVASGSLLALIAASTWLGDYVPAILSLAVLGALAAFIIYNWNPARMYLGDAGSAAIGMFLATALVCMAQPGAVGGKQPYLYQMIIATMVVAYPALEITLSVMRRLFRGQPITRADKGHIHHRLLRLGFGSQGVCATAGLANALLAFAAFSIITLHHGRAVWLLGFAVLMLGTGLPVLGFFNFMLPSEISRKRPHYQIAHHFISMQRIKLKLTQHSDEVLKLMQGTLREFSVHMFRMELNFRDRPLWKFEWAARDNVDDQDGKIQKKEIFMDRVRLSNKRGHAVWSFETGIPDEELDTEHRVLVSEFMEDIMSRLLELLENGEQKLPAGSLRAGELKQRK